MMTRRAATPGRTEKGGLIYESSGRGLDSVYDGAHMMNSIAATTAAKGNPYSSGQAYSSVFRSKMPRTSVPVTLEQKHCPLKGTAGGPAYYQPLMSHSISSSSIHWSLRGRHGAIGSTYDVLRRSPSFSSQVSRYHHTATPPPQRRGINSKDEASMNFVLNSEYRQQSNLRADFLTKLQTTWAHAPLTRVMSAPGL
jgi:hypothetical protein